MSPSATPTTRPRNSSATAPHGRTSAAAKSSAARTSIRVKSSANHHVTILSLPNEKQKKAPAKPIGLADASTSNPIQWSNPSIPRCAVFSTSKICAF